MRNWGDAVRNWAAFSVGPRLAGGCPPRSGGCHRLPLSAKALPLSAKGLPLSAKTCHHLPRAASSWGGPSRSRGPLLSSDINGCVGIVLMGLMLWHSDVAHRMGMRSGASDLIVENQAEGLRSTVTVCHSGRGDLSVGRFGGVGDPRRTRSETCAEQFTRGGAETPNVGEERRHVIALRAKDPLLSRDSGCCNNT